MEFKTEFDVDIGLDSLLDDMDESTVQSEGDDPLLECVVVKKEFLGEYEDEFLMETNSNDEAEDDDVPLNEIANRSKNGKKRKVENMELYMDGKGRSWTTKRKMELDTNLDAALNMQPEAKGPARNVSFVLQMLFFIHIFIF